MSAARQAFGELGERIAERWLRRRGWRVMQRRFRSGHRDIDLVVERDGLVAFVEVKARRGDRFGDPVEAGSRDLTHTLSRGGVCVGVSAPELEEMSMPQTGSLGFVGRELARIEAALPESVPDGARWRALFAAQQALKWATEPQGYAAPLDMIDGVTGQAAPTGIPAATAGCSAAGHPAP